MHIVIRDAKPQNSWGRWVFLGFSKGAVGVDFTKAKTTTPL